MRPRPRQLALAAVALLLGVGAALWVRDASQTAPAAPAPAGEAAAATSIPSPAATQAGAATAPAAPTTPAPAATTGAEPPLLDGDAAQEAILDLVVTYDAASVPALARYLAHRDPELRAAARDGLIQLGERAAIPFLEAAARTAPAEEAKALREAAEFLALPTWTEHRAAQRAAGAAAGERQP